MGVIGLSEVGHPVNFPLDKRLVMSQKPLLSYTSPRTMVLLRLINTNKTPERGWLANCCFHSAAKPSNASAKISRLCSDEYFCIAGQVDHDFIKFMSKTMSDLSMAPEKHNWSPPLNLTSSWQGCAGIDE